MKKAIAIALFISACGYSSKSNELVGQVKKVIEETPIVCSDYAYADISLGVLRNGAGSVSHEDVILYVPNRADAEFLKKAAEDGSPVKVTYDIKRWPAGLCVPTSWLTHVEGLAPLPTAAPEAK